MITLRPATGDDIEALWALRTRAVAHACAGHYSEDVLAVWLASEVPDSMPGLLASGGGIVAVEDGRMLGYAVWNAASGEVDCLFVEPAQHGRGVGGMLMQAIEQAARVTRSERLLLSASLNAVPFYQRAGFVAVREELDAGRQGSA